MKKSEMPTLVKVISVLYYVFSGILLLGSLFALFGAGYITAVLSSIPIINILGAIGTGMLIFLGIVMLGFGVLEFFIGRGLWKGQSWARIFVIVLAILGVLGSLGGLATGIGIIGLLYNGAVGGYLLFSKEAKKAFGK